jgi:hypothetical protein
LICGCLVAWFMVFKAIFNNISVISWRSFVSVDETGVSGENLWLVASHWQTLSHNVISSTPRHERHSNSLIVTDCTGSCKSHYHTITSTTAPIDIRFICWPRQNKTDFTVDKQYSTSPN